VLESKSTNLKHSHSEIMAVQVRSILKSCEGCCQYEILLGVVKARALKGEVVACQFCVIALFCHFYQPPEPFPYKLLAAN